MDVHIPLPDLQIWHLVAAGVLIWYGAMALLIRNVPASMVDDHSLRAGLWLFSPLLVALAPLGLTLWGLAKGVDVLGRALTPREARLPVVLPPIPDGNWLPVATTQPPGRSEQNRPLSYTVVPVGDGEAFCDHCARDTPHRLNFAGHERASSGDSRTCLLCGWRWSGLTDEYTPPTPL